MLIANKYFFLFCRIFITFIFLAIYSHVEAQNSALDKLLKSLGFVKGELKTTTQTPRTTTPKYLGLLNKILAQLNIKIRSTTVLSTAIVDSSSIQTTEAVSTRRPPVKGLLNQILGAIKNLRNKTTITPTEGS